MSEDDIDAIKRSIEKSFSELLGTPSKMQFAPNGDIEILGEGLLRGPVAVKPKPVTIDELCDEIEALVKFGENLNPDTTVADNPVFLGKVRKFEAKVANCLELDENPMGPGIKLMVKALLIDIENRKIGS